MDNTQNIPTIPDFSDIPALGDVQGLENYLNNETLKQQGLQVQSQPVVQQAATQPVQAQAQATTQQQPTQQVAQTQPAAQSGDGNVTLTREQFNALLAGKGIQVRQEQPQQAVQKSAGYSAQEQAFIQKALSQGYSLDQINNFLVSQKGATGNPVLEQRLNQVEQYLKTQEYKTAETAFINKLTDFGSKWGLSEQDLVSFGNEALKHGINIAGTNVDLDMVFRAVYPDQYAIRSRRMTPTPSSQIYGGTSVPEASRASAAKLEDAYVENFLRGAMPNQYGMLNKK